MSISLRNQTTGILERAAGFSDTDAVLSPTSRNPIQNKAVYDALAQKIEKTVTDLENYYNTSQTYNKQEVRDLIGSINTLTIEVVATLPTSEISSTTIYFVGPKAGTTSTYDEYIYVNGTWVQIGDTTIDLSNYVTSANLTTILQSYYTKTQTDALFNDYYDKDNVDDLLDLKQDALTFDNTPTAGSSNPVTSNGIRTAISNAIVSSAGGSIIKVHHLDGGTVAGDTVTASKGSFSVSTTFDNNGDAIITGVGEIGTIQVTATNGTDVGVAFINAPSFSLYSTTISYGVNYKSWLEAGGLNPSSYSSLDEVLEDEEAIRRLFTIHTSVDYLTAAILTDDNEDAIKIFNNDLCAKWISLRDYAMDTLPTNEHIATMMEDADKYGYGEWALKNSALNPSRATASTYYDSQYTPAMGFNDNTRGWLPASSDTVNNCYIQYSFDYPIIISKVGMRGVINNSTSTGIRLFELYVSSDGSNWSPTGTILTVNGYSTEIITNQTEISTPYQYYRFVLKQLISGSMTAAAGFKIYFYAWQPKGNVPIMTSDTAPYGTAISSAAYSGMEAYRAFDGLYTIGYASNAMTTSGGDYLGYKFTNPANIKRIFMYNINGDKDGWKPNIKFQYSDDGSTWSDIDNGTIVPFNDYFLTYNIQNDAGYHLYWRVYKTSSSVTGVTGRLGVAVLQFYGREMKASIPTMTSNTTPYGVASGTTYKSGGDYYKAFVPFASNQSGWAAATGETSASIYYQFSIPQKLKGKIGFCLCACQAGGVGKQIEVTAVASNDGTTWVDISDPITLTMIMYNNNPGQCVIDVESDDYYNYFGLDINGTMYISGNYQLALTNLNFYNFDYSEYDWDTEHPMKYIYDHGVELETLTLGSTVSKEESQIITNGDTTSANTLAYTNNIDLSSYSLLRLNIGNKFKAYGGMYVSNTDTVTWDASTWLGNQQWSTVNYPTADAGLDINSINLSKKVGFGTGGAAGRQMSVTEFWLE